MPLRPLLNSERAGRFWALGMSADVAVAFRPHASRPLAVHHTNYVICKCMLQEICSASWAFAGEAEPVWSSFAHWRLPATPNFWPLFLDSYMWLIINKRQTVRDAARKLKFAPQWHTFLESGSSCGFKLLVIQRVLGSGICSEVVLDPCAFASHCRSVWS